MSYDLPHHRVLRLEEDRRLQRLGVLAILAGVLPVSEGLGSALWLWELLPVAGVAESLRLLAPILLGLGLLVIVRSKGLTRLGLGLAASALLAVAITLFTDSWLGYTQLFGGFLAYVGRQPLAVFVGLTITAIGADLRRYEGSDRAGRALLVVGGLALLVLYALPQRGVPFALQLVDSFDAALSADEVRVLMGSLLFWLFAIFPLFLALWGLAAARSKKEPGLLGSTARYGLACLAVLLGYRYLIGGLGLIPILLLLRAALLLAVGIGVASVAIGAILRHLLADELPPRGERSNLARDIRLRQVLRAYIASEPEAPADPFATGGVPESHPLLVWLMRRRLAQIAADEPEITITWQRERATLGPGDAALALRRLEGQAETSAEETPREDEPSPRALHIMSGRARLPAVIALVALISAGGWLWRTWDPAPDLAWELTPAAEADRRFFSTQLPRYVARVARAGTEMNPDETYAEVIERLQDERKALLEAAASIHPELDEAVAKLLEVIDRVDLEGRTWLDAVIPINRRIRSLGLPYYLEPEHITMATREGERRYFFLMSYLVEDIQRFDHEGTEYGVLRVRRIDPINLEGAHLGYVLPDEPFALVNIERNEEAVRAMLDAVAFGGCGLREASDSPAARSVDRTCGRLLSKLIGEVDDPERAESADARLLETQLALTERHEIQHQVDGEGLAIPRELYRLVPLATDVQLSRAARELSAHICELREGEPAALVWSLAQLSAFLLTGSVQQSPYRYAAGIAIGELHGQPIIKPMGAVEEVELRRFWEALESEPGRLSALADRADAIHEDLFGDPCAALTRL